MARIVVNMSVTLDGVMQAPGRPGEDRRGGFELGGWARPFSDPVLSTVTTERIARSPGLLLGRRTYEDLRAVWQGRADGPFARVLHHARKFVVSNTLREPLPWTNSELLVGDACTAVGTLKQELRKDIVALGSGELVRSLIQADLVDEYVLSIHPLVLGSGQRLFGDRVGPSTLRLIGARLTTTGVVIATFRPVKVEPGVSYEPLHWPLDVMVGISG